jgi:hypothetical protein
MLMHRLTPLRFLRDIDGKPMHSHSGNLSLGIYITNCQRFVIIREFVNQEWIIEPMGSDWLRHTKNYDPSDPSDRSKIKYHKEWSQWLVDQCLHNSFPQRKKALEALYEELLHHQLIDSIRPQAILLD